MFDPYQSQQERELMKRDIPITEYAASLGFTLVQKGRFVSTKEHDSIMIDPVTNTYRQFSVSPYKKSIIDFSMQFENKSQSVATRDLMELWKQHHGTFDAAFYQSSSPQPEKPPDKAEFQLPKRDTNHKNVYAYLTKTRNIDKEIVEDFLHRNFLYQEKEHKNCVFVGYDSQQNPVFGSLRGTNSERRFLRDLPGSDYQQCMYIDNGKNTLIVTESAIDCMSVMSLTLAKGNDPGQSNYLVLSGVSKISSLFHHIQNNPQINRVILALDYDNAGMEAAKTAADTLRAMEFPGTIAEAFPKIKKDWNEELQYIKDHQFRPDYFIPNQPQQQKLQKYCQSLLTHKWFDKPIENEDKQIIELRRSHVPDGIVDILKQINFPDVEEDCDISDTISKAIDNSILFFNSEGREPPQLLQKEEPIQEAERLTVKKPSKQRRELRKEENFAR
ncbi:MAG: DUF3991 domain-containing protein [Clostridiales bacterium]|jgi:hypothetical protein|nr:DUF3991 domain-containing protein [Clostridiales bacterium]